MTMMNAISLIRISLSSSGAVLPRVGKGRS